MFSLIITIIAIALVAALAVSSIYYGGSAFTEGSGSANASGVVGAVGQVQTGRILYKQQVKAVPADIDALMTSNHLSGIPKLPLPDGVTVTWYTDYTTESATIGDGALVVYTSEVTGTDSTTIKALCDEINAMMEEATTTYTEAQDGPTLQFTNVTSQITCGEQETATGSEFFIIARGS